MSFWIIQDFPDTAKFLTEAERTIVIRRLQSDDQFSAAGEKLKMKYIWKSLLDWKTWIGSASSTILVAGKHHLSLLWSSDRLRWLRYAALRLLTIFALYHQSGVFHCL